MKKQIGLALFLVSLLFLTSCEGGSKSPTTVSGFIGGTNGLVATYTADEPPAKVLDGNTPFAITLLLENKGEHSLAPGEVVTTLQGIDYSTFQITKPDQKNLGSIEGISLDTANKALPGGKSQDLRYDAAYKESVPASQPFTIITNYCYKYQTQAIAKTCLKKDITSRASPNDVCKVEGVKAASNSGAPIQVTSISERPAGKNQIELVVQIENKGKGEVYDPSFLSKGTCVTDQDPKTQNLVHVKVAFLGNEPAIKCAQLDNKAEGNVRLIQNKQWFNCLVDTGSLQSSTFEKPINVVVDYVYKDFISKQIIVEKSI